MKAPKALRLTVLPPDYMGIPCELREFQDLEHFFRAFALVPARNKRQEARLRRRYGALEEMRNQRRRELSSMIGKPIKCDEEDP